jgi:hypothetical protein
MSEAVSVIPAQAGIQGDEVDSRFRGNDMTTISTTIFHGGFAATHKQ